MRLLMKDHFFSILGHLAQRRHQEDQLSNTFQACFKYSSVFRETIMGELFRLLGSQAKNVDAGRWSCRTQVHTRAIRGKSASSRHDIRLELGDGYKPPKGIPPLLILESKLGAPLKASQLNEYKLHPKSQLVAVTKRYPDASPLWMQENGICFLRWQDFHRALKRADQGLALEKFLIREFLLYLEVSGMAYPEISLSGLTDLADLFFNIHGQPQKEMVKDLSFVHGDDCLRMLNYLSRDVRGCLPQNNSWSTWGPGYCHYTEDNVTYHDLAFELYKGNYKRGPRIYCALHFPYKKKGGVYWGVGLKKSGESDYGPDYHYMAINKFCKNAQLDKDLLVNHVQSCLKGWKMLK